MMLWANFPICAREEPQFKWYARFSGKQGVCRNRKGGGNVSREESLAYRRECPYDAMGDYSVFVAKDRKNGETGKPCILQPDISVKAK